MENPAGLLDGIDDHPALIDGHREGLLDIDVLACQGGFDADFGVAEVRGADHDGIDGGIRQQFVVIGRRLQFGKRVVTVNALGAADHTVQPDPVTVRQRNQRGGFGGLRESRNVHAGGDTPAADHTHLDTVGRGIRSEEMGGYNQRSATGGAKF